MAVFARKYAGQETKGVLDLKKEALENIQSVGDKGRLGEVLVVSDGNLGEKTLFQLVWMGNPLEIETSEGGGPYVSEKSSQCYDLLEPSDNERGQRRWELDNSYDQENGLRLSQSRTLQANYFFLLWWSKPQPCYPQECRMSYKYISDYIMVSVHMITYNQERYIAEAIEGVLNQRTSFKIELVIGEDFSTDSTKNICLEYANKYPEIIKLLPSDRNYGMSSNGIRTYKECIGKYIALCEGDDYWTDPYKLQKQVDFMEKRPSCSLCFHNSLVKYDDHSNQERLFCPSFVDKQKFNTKNIILYPWFIPTQSILIRRSCLVDFPAWFSTIYNGDLAMQLLLSVKGDIIYLNDCMSVYRKNAINSISLKKKNPVFFIDKKISLLIIFNKYTNHRYAYYIYIKCIILIITKIKIQIKTKIKS